VGGWFTVAGEASADYVARWDGASWSPLGAGMNWGVYALTTCYGAEPKDGGSVLQVPELIAGGLFTLAGGAFSPGIAAWNGMTWDPIGPSGTNHGVYALEVYEGDLIAGGSFTQADTVPANRIACWNGTGWEALGNGMDNTVWVLDLYGPVTEDLIAGGEFVQAGDTLARRLAEWDGIEWQPLGELDFSGIARDYESSPAERLVMARPNPFHDGVELAVLSTHGGEHLRIFDISGRLVRTLDIKESRVHRSRIIWNGRDETGLRVAPGIYFAVMDDENRDSAVRVVNIH
jgi:hypothetical protein